MTRPQTVPYRIVPYHDTHARLLRYGTVRYRSVPLQYLLVPTECHHVPIRYLPGTSQVPDYTILYVSSVCRIESHCKRSDGISGGVARLYRYERSSKGNKKSTIIASYPLSLSLFMYLFVSLSQTLCLYLYI